MICSFKSYYVVWKQYITNAIPVRPPAFKSYYVVWKQEDEENKKDKQTV